MGRGWGPGQGYGTATDGLPVLLSPRSCLLRPPPTRRVTTRPTLPTCPPEHMAEFLASTLFHTSLIKLDSTTFRCDPACTKHMARVQGIMRQVVALHASSWTATPLVACQRRWRKHRSRVMVCHDACIPAGTKVIAWAWAWALLA